MAATTTPRPIMRPSNVTYLPSAQPTPPSMPSETVRPLPKEPEYIKLYVEDIARLFHLQSGHQEILLYVAASVDYEGIVSLTAGRKERIAVTCACSVKSVNNAIGEYVKAGILKRIARGDYELDPKLFAKGEWRNIRDRRLKFRTVYEYSPKGGRTVTTEVKADQGDDERQAK
jgi:hypothetical protein